MASQPTPAWVLGMVRDLVARRKPVHIIAGLITHAGFDCNPRQVKRWKEKHGIGTLWRGDDAALDQVVTDLHADDELGVNEGYRWAHSVVSDRLPPGLSVGAARVRKAMRRADPAAVDQRKKMVEKRLQRRIYVAHYYGQSDHVDFECKAKVGKVRLYIYGQVRSPQTNTDIASARTHACADAPHPVPPPTPHTHTHHHHLHAAACTGRQTATLGS